MIYRVLDDITVAVHYLVMAYIVFGGFLAWRWRWTIFVHGAFICWAIITLTVPNANCPLTYLEDFFRQQGNLPALHGGFIETYITGVLYPVNYVHVVQILCGAIVLTSWIGLYVKNSRNHPRADRQPVG